MSLIQCIECGRQISTRAIHCIHCGCPISVLEPNGRGETLVASQGTGEVNRAEEVAFKLPETYEPIKDPVVPKLADAENEISQVHFVNRAGLTVGEILSRVRDGLPAELAPSFKTYGLAVRTSFITRVVIATNERGFRLSPCKTGGSFFVFVLIPQAFANSILMNSRLISSPIASMIAVLGMFLLCWLLFHLAWNFSGAPRRAQERVAQALKSLVRSPDFFAKPK